MTVETPSKAGTYTHEEIEAMERDAIREDAKRKVPDPGSPIRQSLEEVQIMPQVGMRVTMFAIQDFQGARPADVMEVRDGLARVQIIKGANDMGLPDGEAFGFIPIIDASKLVDTSGRPTPVESVLGLHTWGQIIGSDITTRDQSGDIAELKASLNDVLKDISRSVGEMRSDIQKHQASTTEGIAKLTDRVTKIEKDAKPKPAPKPKTPAKG